MFRDLVLVSFLFLFRSSFSLALSLSLVSCFTTDLSENLLNLSLSLFQSRGALCLTPLRFSLEKL